VICQNDHFGIRSASFRLQRLQMPKPLPCFSCRSRIRTSHSCTHNISSAAFSLMAHPMILTRPGDSILSATRSRNSEDLQRAARAAVCVFPFAG
jgi:hypothetical protein